MRMAPNYSLSFVHKDIAAEVKQFPAPLFKLVEREEQGYFVDLAIQVISKISLEEIASL